MASDDSDLEVYTVNIGGIPHTMQLDPKDAKRYGNLAQKVGAADVTSLEQQAQQATPVATKQTTPLNK